MPLTTSNQPGGADGGAPDNPKPGDLRYRSEWETKRTISHEEAHDIARRLIASHFRRADCETARASIPARPDYDDDLLINAYIKQQARKDAALASTARAGAGDWQPIWKARRDGTLYRLRDKVGSLKGDPWEADGWYENGPADRCWYTTDDERCEPTEFRELTPDERATADGQSPAVPASPISTGEEKDQGASFGPDYSAEPEPARGLGPSGEYSSREAEAPEFWRVRGIGNDWHLTCVVTGKTADLMPNVSGFVTSREAGERVVKLFGGRARLDYREHEPNWVQVKVGALVEHEDVLVRLCDASRARDGIIDARAIAWALDPTGSPGYRPRALAPVDRSPAGAETHSGSVEDESAVTGAARQAPWPSGCIKPGSCSRHATCMYAQTPEKCRHFGKDLTAEIEEASHAR